MLEKGYYSSPRLTAEVLDCSMPMTFDTYSNCSFGCLYCFAQFQRGIGGGKEQYLQKTVKAVNVEKVKRMFTDPDKYAGYFAPYIKQRRVMQWGGLSDQFDGFERQYGKTLELLRFFKDINYPLCFSTKATWFTKDARYMDLIRGQRNWNFKFSVITLDEAKARVIERGVPSPWERLDAIERIAKADAGGATLRLRPFIIGISTPTYLDLIHEAGQRGASALSTEFFCVEQRSEILKENFKTINELCGFDLQAFYKKYSYQNGLLRLNRNVKRPFVDRMEEACKQEGMRFYVSDAHFKERCCNGSCCGLGEGWNYSRGQFTNALLIAKEKGIVKWSDIAPEAEAIHGGWLSINGINDGKSETKAKFDGMSVAEVMRYYWNNPQRGQSPYRYFEGVMKPVGKDENGDLIYKYDKTRE